MSKYLATFGIAAMLMGSTAWANDVSARSDGKLAAEQLQIPPITLPTKALTLKMLIAQVDSFNSRTAEGGLNPMEAAITIKGEISTVGGPGTETGALDFASLNRDGLSRLLLADPRLKTSEMFSLETVGLPVPLPTPSPL